MFGLITRLHLPGAFLSGWFLSLQLYVLQDPIIFYDQQVPYEDSLEALYINNPTKYASDWELYWLA